MKVIKKLVYWLIGLNIMPLAITVQEYETFASLWDAYLLGWIFQAIMIVLILIVSTIIHNFYDKIEWIK